MNTETQTIEMEVMQADDKLARFAEKTGLEKTSTSALVAAFQPIFEKARKAISDSDGVAASVKDATCVKEIRKSRECRLALRAVRLESDKVRKAQKEHALLYGRAVDGFHNILLADLSPVETALQEAEDIAERAEAARLAQLKADREKELQPLLEAPIMGDLSAISEADYGKMLADAKLLKQAKLDAIAKEEAQARAKAESERIERERIAAENERLKKEALALESAAKAEREAAEKKLAEERAAAESARKLAEEKARKEREAIESKAREERAAAEEAARKERFQLQALAELERKKAAAAEAAAKAIRDAETKKAAEAAAEAKKADAAPDNAKAKAFAEMLRDLPLPQFKSSKAFDLLPQKIEELAVWIDSQIERSGR